MREPTILETGDVVVVDKPAGWVAHAARADEPADVRAWLRARGHEVDPVHRLDRETSGLVLYAAEPDVRRVLGGLFAEGRVEKTYLALVFGRTHRKGIVRKPLSDGRRGVPLEAVTRWRADEALGGFTLLRVRPETGRKHQIRRHLQAIGHPIVGDDRYGPRRFRPVPAFPGRLWLHAARVALPDGRAWEAPLPDELQEHLEVLRVRASATAPQAGDPGEPQAVGIVAIALGASFAWFAAGAVLLGLGTAMVYPTLLAAIGDVAHPSWRATSVGVYRLWRDMGYAVGALLAGLVADAFGLGAATLTVAALTVGSGVVVAVRMKETLNREAA